MYLFAMTVQNYHLYMFCEVFSYINNEQCLARTGSGSAGLVLTVLLSPCNYCFRLLALTGF